jgi:hypothetical protein
MLSLSLLGACSLATDGEAREPGIVQSQSLTTPVLVAPSTVSAGQTFQVTVTTLGLSGCYRVGGADVTYSSTQATIRPFDRVRNTGCTASTITLPRTVALHFDTPGTMKIVVEGQNDPSTGQTAIARVEQTVTVQ